jgi:uncharacterized protein (DUF302 family)
MDANQAPDVSASCTMLPGELDTAQNGSDLKVVFMPRARSGFGASTLLSLIAMIWLWGAQAMAAEGLTTIPSSFGPKETMDRLVAEIMGRGLIVFMRIDHAAQAAQVGLPLRPTELIIFGNPKAGTPLMQSNQTIGIDLPLKALVWEDANGKAWLSYNDPAWLEKRHGLNAEADRTVSAIAAMLSAVAGKATGHLQ